jgi:hypothetical protein
LSEGRPIQRGGCVIIYHSGSTPSAAAIFLKERHGLELSGLDIGQVKADFPDFAEAESETDALLRLVEYEGGRSDVFTIETLKRLKKAAMTIVICANL